MLPIDQKNSGFTLIEILVALAILAIALSALMGSTNTIARNGVAIQERILASWVAEDVLNEFRISNQWPPPGTNNGKRDLAGLQWDWRLNVEETREHNIFKASIDVYLPDGNENSISSLTTYFSRYLRSAETFESEK